ncbi:hypothetical protein UFOVP327_3 [uncultured Caudovirales phage]|uniref:Uncharacterized protein n=1 Tax=uncultured Caudovirales phage TaxID=2100421 RepID=A0A6J5LRG9_9CAUD|nr:hypothetical protein UFOVP327_3 [uncultured Caudovirales phage]
MAKIDLYNNHDVYITEQRQNQAIDRHCHRLKISRKKLETHPNITDLVTLMSFDQHQVWMTDKDQQIWRHTWAWVYHKELPLNTYHKRKLISILDSIEYRQRNQKHMKKAITMTSKKGRPLPSSTNGQGQ